MRISSIVAIAAALPLFACAEQASESSTAPAQLVACPIAVDTFKAVGVSPDMTVVIDPIPTPDPPPPGTPPMLCCLHGSCTPMDLPPIACEDLPVADDAIQLSNPARGVYDGPKVPTAIYGGSCDDDDDDHCEAGDGAALYENGGQVLGLVVFDDEEAQTDFDYYPLPEPGTYKVPSGKVMHAVLAHGEPFANPAAAAVVGGVVMGELNFQTDCRQTACGVTCTPC